MDNTNTFMELATPRDGDEVVRVQQLDAAPGGLQAVLKSNTGVVRLGIAGRRTEARTGFAGPRAEMTCLRTEMTGLLATVL